MSISVKLQKFEGPLDLLLHLIEKNKINIYDIPVAEITDQYMEALGEIQTQDYDLDVMSEFLVMAATLLDIKSRMLLPVEKDEDGEPLDPRAELVEQLLEYKLYKYMAGRLREDEKAAAGAYFRDPRIPKEVKSYQPQADPHEVLGDLTLPGLFETFQRLLKTRDERVDTVRSGFGRIEQEPVDLRETMRRVEEYILDHPACTFEALLPEDAGRMDIVMTFFTLLELIKMGRANVSQDETGGEISISLRDRSEWQDDGSAADLLEEEEESI